MLLCIQVLGMVYNVKKSSVCLETEFGLGHHSHVRNSQNSRPVGAIFGVPLIETKFRHKYNKSLMCGFIH